MAVSVARHEDGVAVVVADSDIGLAIAKHLVEAHGGRIWAESAGEGRGAKFTFVVPMAPA